MALSITVNINEKDCLGSTKQDQLGKSESTEIIETQVTCGQKERKTGERTVRIQ